MAHKMAWIGMLLSTFW